MKKVIPIILIIILLASKNNINNKVILPDDSIRLRVLANSNSKYDQQVKGKVSNNLQYQMYNLLKDTTDIDVARELIKDNINNIDNNVKNTLKQENYNLSYNVDYGYHYFPEKEYKGVVYNSGEYESVLVTLGKGEGNNWWCVLFPPLCLLEAEEGKKDKVEYKSFVAEIISRIFNK